MLNKIYLICAIIVIALSVVACSRNKQKKWIIENFPTVLYNQMYSDALDEQYSFVNASANSMLIEIKNEFRNTMTKINDQNAVINYLGGNYYDPRIRQYENEMQELINEASRNLSSNLSKIKADITKTAIPTTIDEISQATIDYKDIGEKICDRGFDSYIDSISILLVSAAYQNTKKPEIESIEFIKEKDFWEVHFKNITSRYVFFDEVSDKIKFGDTPNIENMIVVNQ